MTIRCFSISIVKNQSRDSSAIYWDAPWRYVFGVYTYFRQISLVPSGVESVFFAALHFTFSPYFFSSFLLYMSVSPVNSNGNTCEHGHTFAKSHRGVFCYFRCWIQILFILSIRSDFCMTLIQHILLPGLAIHAHHSECHCQKAVCLMVFPFFVAPNPSLRVCRQLYIFHSATAPTKCLLFIVYVLYMKSGRRTSQAKCENATVECIKFE